MKPILCYKFTYDGSTCYCENASDLIAMLEAELEELGIESDGVKFKIQLAVMTREQLDKLPEFEGF